MSSHVFCQGDGYNVEYNARYSTKLGTLLKERCFLTYYCMLSDRAEIVVCFRSILRVVHCLLSSISRKLLWCHVDAFINTYLAIGSCDFAEELFPPRQHLRLRRNNIYTSKLPLSDLIQVFGSPIFRTSYQTSSITKGYCFTWYRKKYPAVSQVYATSPGTPRLSCRRATSSSNSNLWPST